MADEPYANIREFLGGLIGKRVVEITQHDEEEWEETRQGYVLLHFEDGSLLRFFQHDGACFEVYCPGGYDQNSNGEIS